MPLVIAAKEKNALRLAAVDGAAARLGLHQGQPLANARAMVPDLAVAEADDAADDALLVRLAEWCDRFTPLVAVEGKSGLVLDITGASHLFAGEAALLKRITSALRASGLAVQAAIAATALAAMALARHCAGRIVGEGQEREALSPLPIAALPLSPTIIHAFRRAGLKTLGQVASRKRVEITSRFGAATLALLDEAFGLEGKPISPRRPAPDFWQAHAFAEPVATHDIIRATVLALAQSLCALLEKNGMGARHVEAAFFRSDGAVRRIAVETARPTCEALIIDRLFHERLEAVADPLDPGFGFDLIRLCALRVEPVRQVAQALDADQQQHQDIAFLVDRLAARFGRTRILRLAPRDTHIPEAAWQDVPAQNGEDVSLTWPVLRVAGVAPRRPLRLLVRPEPVDVQEPPLRFSWRKASHLIIRWEGPERIAMEWWRAPLPLPARDYYRAEDEQGRRFWLYCDPARAPPQWFMHGIFA